ncbi:hypothetical protein PG997_005984 [Apiospora hydei]|uniref:MYND-type domain-containing protein n=1 Tax=Apiospora hydei TaxID=1337664 RepID=A0ABR1WMQ6_9PEZI
MANECNTCKKTGIDLKKCSKCQTTLYCSRDCQKADWKSHKKSPPRGLDGPIYKPYTHLHERKWLHDRPEKDVYRLLIDCYRMRMADYVKFDGLAEAGSVQGGAADPEPSFRCFLQAVEAKPELLPPWWDDVKKEACVQLGRSGDDWSRLRCAVEKDEVVEHYGDTSFAMQLRLFGEQVFGNTPGTFGNGAQVIEGMMRMEAPSDLVWSRAHLGF